MVRELQIFLLGWLHFLLFCAFLALCIDTFSHLCSTGAFPVDQSELLLWWLISSFLLLLLLVSFYFSRNLFRLLAHLKPHPDSRHLDCKILIACFLFALPFFKANALRIHHRLHHPQSLTKSLNKHIKELRKCSQCGSSPPSPLCRKRLMSCLHSLHAVHRRAVPNNTLLYSYRIYNGRWMRLEGKTIPEGIVVRNLQLLFTELCVYGALSLIWTLDSAADMWSLNNDFRPQWFLALWTFGVGIESNGTKFAQNMELSYCGRSLY